MHLRADSASLFDLAFGLPLHPLAVHAPVVLLPLGAVSLILLLVVPRWRAALAWPVITVFGIAAVAALVAKLSGEALAERVGSPGQHELLGNWVLVMASALFAATLAWWLWQRRTMRPRRPTGVMGLIAGTVLAALAVGAVIVTVLTGHTGAERVWQDRIGVPAESAPTSETAAPAPTGQGSGPITIADVAQHDDSASCWAAVEGTVYDLTQWITQHPGGSDRILSICGTDATAAFSDEHQGDAEPAEELSRFAIGELAEP